MLSSYRRSAKRGKVYLVGAGPGDPELITVRGLSLLRQAEVVVYDRLVHPMLLEVVPPTAERVYVGKTPGHHMRPQEAIQELLIDRARRNLVVVRLKGGDPFVFGRGGEEAQALARAGIPFEVVPGVTSAIAVPAYAGIPVTQRGVAGAFAVVTGHRCDLETLGLDWSALARIDTLVLLMGLRRLPELTRTLQAYGRAPDTPVAVISNGTTAAQQRVIGTLADIAERAATLSTPATVVVGKVAHLAHELDWFHPEPAPSPFTLHPEIHPSIP
ncbi:MAG: uroporphyrinogen-III C-methyltransferase [Rhodothermus sp.]|nr:uroporphyrinogen-III C-methyltransferase [Rhodothermus sp.]